MSPVTAGLVISAYFVGLATSRACEFYRTNTVHLLTSLQQKVLVKQCKAFR